MIVADFPNKNFMNQKNQQIVDRFFEAFQKHDRNAIKEVMDENACWYFLGRHPLAGVKKGLDEVIKFFDTMAGIMAKSKPTIEKPIVSENENYLIECVHTKTNSDDGINVDHFATVLWTFKN